MGLSSNQARFLSLTSRQVDLERRIQQICQRRLRLASELENVATSYNNSISNRKMFTKSLSGLQSLTVNNLEALGYRVTDSGKNKIFRGQQATAPAGFTAINSQADFMTLVSQFNSDIGLNGRYILNCDIDLSSIALDNSLINHNFSGVFDGNGHTISGMNINTGGLAINNIGLFSSASGATIQNVVINNSNINASGSSYVGLLIGTINGSTVSNCSVTGTVLGGADRVAGAIGGSDGGDVVSNISVNANVTGGGNRLGGVTGSAFGGTIVQNCASSGTVTANSSNWGVGGIVGDLNSSTISSCYSSMNIFGTATVGGVAGINCGALVRDCYSDGSSSGGGSTSTGGLVGYNIGACNVINSYSTANVTGGYPGSGFIGARMDASSGESTGCFYDNNLTGPSYNAVDIGSGGTSPVSSWDSAVWNKSTTLPTLKNAGYIPLIENLEEGLRNGTYSLVREADEFTQDPLSFEGDEYEEIDWRSVPEINDELYKGDDVEAENKYDKIIEEINAQDKKLQIEQTSVEVEYKAISSERESVKKILDQNAQSSFKYFS